MKTHTIRGVTDSDLVYMSEHLRLDDVREIFLSRGNKDILGQLRITVHASEEAFVGEVAGKPVLLFGYLKISEISSVIWAVGTPEIKKYNRIFLRECRKSLKDWFVKNPSTECFWNFTYLENTLHHRWLEWCGADLLPALPLGVNGAMFLPFTIKRSAYDV